MVEYVPAVLVRYDALADVRVVGAAHYADVDLVLCVVVLLIDWSTRRFKGQAHFEHFAVVHLH